MSPEPMETMNTDTPETNEALATILEMDGYLSEDNAPDVLVKLSRTMERERDNARERVDTMFARYVDILEQTRNERDDLAAALNRACANPTTGNWYREAQDAFNWYRETQDALAAWKEERK